MNSIKENEFLSSSQFAERMTANVIRYYNDPDRCFSIAKEMFSNYHSNWTDSEKIRALMSFFRDCYKAYPAEEKRELGTRFLTFTSDLGLSQKTFGQLFESFFLLIRKRSEANDFIVSAIKQDGYMDIVNDKFKNEFQDPDFSLFRDIFARRIEEIADYLYDDTYLSIAKEMTDRYTLYDSVIKALLRRKKQKILLAFLDNGNLLISPECLESIIQYAKDNQLYDLLKFSYHTFLYKTSVSFTDFYTYFNLLSEEEKKKESSYLNRIIEVNNLRNPFLISQRKEKNSSLLKGLTIEEFKSLADIIKTDYKEEYLSYLMDAIKIRLLMLGDDFSDLFSCMEVYRQDWKEILKLEEFDKVSKLYSDFRKRYLMMLLEIDSLNIAGIKEYQG